MVRTDSYTRPETHRYECTDCLARIESEDRLIDCPDCGSRVRNVAVPRE
jgi:Zn finger protein HypA/HybF involved in hydrogenase expression